MPNQTRAIATAIAGILILTFNIIDAANRGSSVWNFLAIAVGAFLLFWGFAEIARSGRQAPPSGDTP
jgi:sulfite exporter TauE/SafE